MVVQIAGLYSGSFSNDLRLDTFLWGHFYECAHLSRCMIVDNNPSDGEFEV